MQDRRRQKPQKPAPIYKPILRGTWRSKQCLRRGLKIFVYLLGFIFVYLFLGQVLLFDNAFLRVALNLLLVVGFAGLLYSDGAKAGMDDVTFGEIALQRQQEGRPLEADALQRSYHPAKGFCAAAVGVAPVFLVALMFAFITQLQVYSLGGLPGWVAGLERRADISLALAYYQQAPVFGLEQALRILVRLAIFPYINMAGTGSAQVLLWMERLSPLLVLLVPTGYAIGYLQSKRLRAGVHGAISSNANRRVRRERRERRRRQQQDKQLV